MSTLAEAVELLAERCDGAVTRDGAGFNKVDAILGRWMALIGEAAWTPAQRRGMWEMLYKYRKQLSGAGIDYETLPEPPAVEVGSPLLPARAEREYVLAELQKIQVKHAAAAGERPTKDAVLQILRAAQSQSKTITLTEDGYLAVRFERQQRALIDEIKHIAGMVWTHLVKDAWAVSAQNLKAAQALAQFARAHEFACDEKAAALLAEAQAAPPVPARAIYWQPTYNALTLDYERNPALNEEVKAFGGRWESIVPGKWAVRANDQRGLQGLARFARKHEFVCEAEAAARLADAEATPPLPEKMLAVQEGQFVFYFPRNAEIAEAIKGLESWRFISAPTTCWVAPVTGGNVEPVLEICARHGFDYGAALIKAMDVVSTHAENLTASRAEAADLTIEGLGITPRPFQLAGVAYALKNKRVIIGDDMGLGKTLTALCTAQANGAYPALVICPASVKLNWRKEALRALPGKQVVVLNGGKASGEAAQGDIYIVNYDLVKKWIETLRAIPFKLVIVDESHYVKNEKAQRTQLVKELAGHAEYRLLLSGTPILNRPIELAAQLDILGWLDSQFGGFVSFGKRYCDAKKGRYGWDFDGASNLEELNERLRALCYIRREKDQVLSELPPFERVFVPVEVSNRAEINRAERDLVNFLRERAKADRAFNASIAHLPEDEQERLRRERAESAAARASRAEQLVRVTTLRQVVARGKLEAAQEWVQDFLASGQKLVLFAWHKEIQQELLAAFREYNPAHVLGSDSAQARFANVERFQNDPACRLIICSISAAGEGITLTAASRVAFLEHAWNPGKESQAEKRIDRIGQQYPTMAYYLDAPETIDDEMAALIAEKREIIQAATVGGELRAGQTNIMRDLLKRLMAKAGAASEEVALFDTEMEAAEVEA